jgi:predicted ester cyclase
MTVASISRVLNAKRRDDLEATIHDQVAEFDEVVTRKSYRATHRGTFLDTPATGRMVEFT